MFSNFVNKYLQWTKCIKFYNFTTKLKSDFFLIHKYFVNSLDEAIESVSAADKDSNDLRSSDLLVPSKEDCPSLDPVI